MTDRDADIRTVGHFVRRLRRALEYRHPTCAVPGCGATRGLHAHHIRHWEDGGLTELANLVLVCPYHHRLHHRGVITITGPAVDLTVTDSCGPSAEGRIAGARGSRGGSCWTSSPQRGRRRNGGELATLRVIAGTEAASPQMSHAAVG